MRFSQSTEDDPEVAMSPLIDCVFLLLIFFLVTTMLKKWEKQIPVTLPETTSTLSAVAVDQTFIIGLDVDGFAYDGNERKEDGRIRYQPIDDLALFLGQLASERDTQLPLTLAADRDTPMQYVIGAFDACQLAGFQHTSVQLRDR